MRQWMEIKISTIQLLFYFFLQSEIFLLFSPPTSFFFCRVIINEVNCEIVNMPSVATCAAVSVMESS